MGRPRKLPEPAVQVADPTTMTEEERLAYIKRLESALAQTAEAVSRATAGEPEWQPDEKRVMMIQAGPTGEALRLNGKRYVGRVLVTQDEYNTLMEMYHKAMHSELTRMQMRGNLVPPHLLPTDDVSSRFQSQLVAAL